MRSTHPNSLFISTYLKFELHTLLFLCFFLASHVNAEVLVRSMESIKHKGFTEATVARHVVEVVRMS
jgi:cytosine/uracil/thiamine/allantoin permease